MSEGIVQGACVALSGEADSMCRARAPWHRMTGARVQARAETWDGRVRSRVALCSSCSAVSTHESCSTSSMTRASAPGPMGMPGEVGWEEPMGLHEAKGEGRG